MKAAAFALGFAVLLAVPVQAQPARAEPNNKPQPHNVVIFVADGLRYGSVEPGNMPNLSRLKTDGVDFTNSHSLYPTVTTVNASAIATGHYIGDTGNFGNTLYTARPMASLKGGAMGFLENNAVLAEMNQAFGGNYLNETTLIAAARKAGWRTAVIGKEGPVRIQDSTAAADGSETLFLDDATGREDGIGLPGWFADGMKAAFVDGAMPKTAVPNIEQEVHMMKAATRIVLPHFQQSGKPFVLLFWSRDPDMSQHNTRDSLGELSPGINGSSGKAGARNADTMLGELRAALAAQGLDKTTDIFVTADHGFATVDNGARKSGFLARDLAGLLALPLANGMLGDPAHPDAVIAANGGSDVIYLPGANAKQTAGRIVDFLSRQDYAGALFVNDRLGKIPGALPMSAVNLIGAARTPVPDITVSFRSLEIPGCGDVQLCTAGIHDTALQTGQGSHGSLSRAETRNFMAAFGPDFKSGFADPAPVSNADITPTLARIMGLDLPAKGRLRGRVIAEALPGGAPVQAQRFTVQSAPGPDGLATSLYGQSVGETRYFDMANRAKKGAAPPPF